MVDLNEGVTSAAPAEPAPTDSAPAAETAPPAPEPTSSEATTATESTPVPEAAEGSAPAPPGEGAADGQPSGVPSLTEPEQAQQPPAAEPDPPHVLAERLGVPENRRREGFVYYDEREGHGKYKTVEELVRAVERKDEYFSMQKERETALSAERDTFRQQAEAAQADLARAQALLKVNFDLERGADGSVDPAALAAKFTGHFLDEFLPDDLKGVRSVDDIADESRHADFYEARALAKSKAREYFESALKQADEEVQRQREQAERGATLYKERVTPEALQLTTHDQKAAFAKLEGDYRDRLVDLYGRDAELADLVLFTLRAAAVHNTGGYVPASEVPKPTVSTPPQQQPAPQQAPVQEKGGESTTPTDTVPGGSAAAPEPVTTTVTSKPTVPTPPAGSQPRPQKGALDTFRAAFERMG